MYLKYGKRFFDVVFSLFALIILWPVILTLMLLVQKNLGSPILFKQKRPGKGEVIFDMYKFRTMTDKKDKNGNFLSDNERLTKFGSWLRSTSLDELPELINILKGDMSLIGPRPLLIQYLPLYNEMQSHRHDVRPGLTGLAQVNGRNSISWEEKFEYDVRYVTNITFKQDFLILLKTFFNVIKRDGINSSENTTMEPFKGKQ